MPLNFLSALLKLLAIQDCAAGSFPVSHRSVGLPCTAKSAWHTAPPFLSLTLGLTLANDCTLGANSGSHLVCDLRNRNQFKFKQVAASVAVLTSVYLPHMQTWVIIQYRILNSIHDTSQGFWEPTTNGWFMKLLSPRYRPGVLLWPCY